MAKEHRRQCPDCDGPDMGSLFNKGDGRCHECHGTGVDEVNSVFNALVNADKDPCKICSGTGQCQTCGGGGYEFYDDEEFDNSDAYKSSSSNSGSSTGYSSSNYSTDYISSSERKTNEAEREGGKKEFHESLISYPLTGGAVGLGISLIVGFYKGCGMFHYDIDRPGKAYLFDTKDAGEGFWIFPIVGVIIGLLWAILSSNNK